MSPPEKWPPSVHNALHDEQAAIRHAQAQLAKRRSQKWLRRVQQARCRIWVLMMCQMAFVVAVMAAPPRPPGLTNRPPPVPITQPVVYVTNYVTNWNTICADPTNAIVLMQAGEIFEVRSRQFTEDGKLWTKEFETNRVFTDTLPQRDIKVGYAIIHRGRDSGVMRRQ
jgi:hypothetical protein